MKQSAFAFLESERLILRRFADADLLPFLSYLNDPLVARYQTWESYTERGAKEVIEQQRNLEPGMPGQWFSFALELKETRTLIGHVSFKMEEDRQQTEIGFTLARMYHRQGLAFEASACVIDYLFGELGLHRVTAIVDCENERSISLLSRLGMRREGHFVENIWFKGKWGSEYAYAVLRDEWLSKRPKPLAPL
ncbi:MAG: GNAT family protein [Pyrinomonadaceae bacterium]